MPRGSKRGWARVVVGAGPRLQIREASAGWFRLFGFSAGEVAERSLRICSGPKTKMVAIETLVDAIRLPKRRSLGAPIWCTLYDRSGSEVFVVIRAASRLEDGDDIALEIQRIDYLFPERNEKQHEQEQTAEEMASSEDTISVSSTGSSRRNDEQESSFEAPFSIPHSSCVHLQSFLAASRRRDLTGEKGEGQRFPRVISHQRASIEDICS